MGTFDSGKQGLTGLLEAVASGKLQLPDFQRNWRWDDSHIRSLLVSIARRFPVGALMLLEKGGDVRFAERPVEGVVFALGPPPVADKLILDGQQRLTTLTQALKSPEPARTFDDKKVPIDRFYYFDIAKALEGPPHFVAEEAVVAVDADRTVRTNFGRDILLDLSTPEKEYAAMHFPCSQIINSDAWETGFFNWCRSHGADFGQYMAFREKVLRVFRDYQVPVIELGKDNSREAVCLVFEKVNTGGVPLNVFELLTATYAADGFNLRTDWYGDKSRKIIGRHERLAKDPLLAAIETTDFMQAVSLLHTLEHREADLAAGKRPKDSTALSAKRETVLDLPLTAYQAWADRALAGFVEAGKFLRNEQFFSPKLLPYRAQIVPLAALCARIGDDWAMAAYLEKLRRWFWCGVFGELYGGASETRIGNDLEDLVSWLKGGEQEPRTVVDAGFQPSRLDTLRTRLSAAYKGLHILVLREGAKDFYYKQTIQQIDRDEAKLDVHHIFPKKWCEANRIPARRFNAVVNKTPISAKANRSIGGRAPSIYLEDIQENKKVALKPAEMDAILETHLIDPALLRADDFDAFYEARKEALLKLIATAMGKQLLPAAAAVDSLEDEEDEEEALEEALQSTG